MTFQLVDNKVRLVIYRFINVIKTQEDYLDERWSFVYPNVAEYFSDYLSSHETLPFSLMKIVQHILEHSRANPTHDALIPEFGQPEFWEAFAQYVQHILDTYDFENLPSFSQCPCFQLLCNLIIASGLERKLFALPIEPEFVATFEHFRQSNVPQVIWSNCLNVLSEEVLTRILSNTTNPHPSDLTNFFAEFLDERRDLKKLKKLALDKYRLKPYQVLIVAFDPKECSDALLAGFRVAQVSPSNDPIDPEEMAKTRKYEHRRMRIRSISELRMSQTGKNQPREPFDGFILNRSFHKG